MKSVFSYSLFTVSHTSNPFLAHNSMLSALFLLLGQYSYSVQLHQYYSAEYEYTIRPTIRSE